MMRTVVIVHDSACGDCSAIAVSLADVLTARVLVRSCRDPHLPAEFPSVAAYLQGGSCQRPLLIMFRGGPPRVLSGWRMYGHVVPLVPLRRWYKAVRILGRIVATNSAG